MLATREKVYLVADRCAEYFLYCLIFFIPISTAAIGILFVFAYLCFLIKKCIRPDFTFVKNYPHFFLLLFYAFCALSLVHSTGYFKTSFIAFFFKWGKYILIFLMVEDIMRDARKVKNCVIIFLSVSAIMGIDALSQKFLGFEFMRQRPVIRTNNGLYAVTAAFKHFNAFG